MFLSISSNTLSWYSGWLTKHNIVLVSTDQVVKIPIQTEKNLFWWNVLSQILTTFVTKELSVFAPPDFT
jgi:hypothetical protein